MHCKLQNYAGLSLGISSSDFQGCPALWLSQSPAIYFLLRFAVECSNEMKINREEEMGAGQGGQLGKKTGGRLHTHLPL